MKNRSLINFRRWKGQSIAEYVILMLIFTAAAVGLIGLFLSKTEAISTNEDFANPAHAF